MTEYKIVAVLWEDHTTYTRTGFPKKDDVSDLIRPTLTVGLLYKKTDKYVIIAHNIERYSDYDEADYIIIFTNSILSMKEYGQIKLKKLRKGG